MSEVSTLKAMAQNYANGHMWDHLDGEACISAATLIEEQAVRIATLEAEVIAARAGEQASDEYVVLQRAEITLSQARLSEAVKVLEWVNAELKDHGYAEIGTLRETVINAIGTLGGK